MSNVLFGLLEKRNNIFDKQLNIANTYRIQHCA